jgi:hypothetical protein
LPVVPTTWFIWAALSGWGATATHTYFESRVTGCVCEKVAQNVATRFCQS